MNIGKLNWDDLEQIINRYKSVKRDEVIIRNGIGEDCSVIDFGEEECVLSTDPITGTTKNMGKLAVHINCNDIASCGVEPLGIMVTILAPPNVELDDISSIMKEIDEETQKLNIEILGGHTEITDAVNRMVVSCTVIGKGKRGKAVATSGAKDGDDIIVTKDLALEGTGIIINEYKEKLQNILGEEELLEGRTYIEHISVVKEGIICGNFGVNSMHDITEGGVLGALWEMAEASELGFKVYESIMPITNLTKKICNTLNIDALRLISSGSMLITTNRGKELVELLKNNGIKATIIGKITDSKGILVSNHEEVEVMPPKRDELFNIK
ncbi:AIR synthase family protein [Desnuesiella massiliensis]|uniref:AIR synthase family protein n=1 Tax=Desnuesiella massiliensis TaxID=1650662 RepID=UPI0006E4641B|nr:AIR synthase family protein [Desnuesiella massiliensis]